ncbi:MAG: Mu transposase C-terminal domain-containing protein, partial [bacterium]|nr:Mu transposase C-terminal domain-containing protein [bacterium]
NHVAICFLYATEFPWLLVLTLLPRTTGKFSRFGLKVNKLRYCRDGYTEAYLRGDSVTVAYNPDDVSSVWIIENGEYIEFELIETRFKDKPIGDVQMIQEQQKHLVKDIVQDNIQARINLTEHIEAILFNNCIGNDTCIKSIRDNRKRESNKKHINFMEEGDANE